MKESMTKTMTPRGPNGVKRLPLGYVWREDGEGGFKATLDPERAPMIGKAFRKVASGEWTVQWANLWLTYEAGFTTRDGRCLSATSMLRLLMDPAYSDGKLPPLVSEGMSRMVRLIAMNVRAWNQ